MKNRSIVLAVSILCVGIMVMPYTVSLFGGDQHGWVAGGDVACLDCHTDITEPGAGYMHESLGTGQAYCTACHQLGAAGSSAGVTGSGGFDDEHAAATVECLDCHEVAIVGPPAAADVWFTAGDSGGMYINITTEAHSDFVGETDFDQGAWAVDYLAGNNEACIACHTNVTVTTSFTYTAAQLDIDATENVWGNWTVVFSIP